MKLSLEKIEAPVGAIRLQLDLALSHPATGLFGSSGAGKTSLVEIIAGLRRPRTGRFLLDGEVLSDAATGTFVPPERRGIGYLPQDLALFPHLSVEENIAYGRPPVGKAGPDREQVIDFLELGPLLKRSITRLSGGEKQRTAFARALLAGPRLLLCDEPLTGLDRERKERIIGHLRRLLEEFRIPMIYVSHDREELSALCGEVIVLEAGAVLRRGEPAAIL